VVCGNSKNITIDCIKNANTDKFETKETLTYYHSNRLAKVVVFSFLPLGSFLGVRSGRW